ncbi:MAG TPA: adenylate/guanylate cyclase domain-containing protein [Beijerinckiaceae bacterium]|nr:adenylate/guanylate cyclase domain-containing protein [Beijerinckiaceae bacterium]
MLAFLVVAGLVWLRIYDPVITEVARHRVFDNYQKLKPRAYKPAPVAIIDIDEKSLTRVGQWPWARTRVAELVERLKAQGVAAIAFDIVFAEPDRMSPESYAKTVAGLSDAARAELAGLPDNDSVLARAFQGARVVVGQSGTHLAGEQRDLGAVPETPVATIGGDPRPWLAQYPAWLTNVPALEQAATGRGLFSILPDPDGVVRRVPLTAIVGGRLQPALSIETLRVATGQDAFAVKRDDVGVKSVVVAGVEIPTDRTGHLWLHFTPHAPQRFVSAADVLEGKVPPGRLAGHLALIGTSAVGLFDLRPTPVDPVMPGVEIHAQALESILGKHQLTRPHYAIGAEIVAAVTSSALVISLLPLLGALPTLLLGAVGAAIIGGGSWWLFANHGLLLDPLFPLFTSGAAFLVLAFVNYRREEMQRQQIRSAFSHYLAPGMVEALAKDPSKLSLGGERRPLTVLFSDVRGFTSLSESYKHDPQGLIALMNTLLTPLTNAIVAEQGTIDKYMGDAVMAFWNAPLDVPDHPAHAARAALAMQNAMTEVNARAQASATRDGRALPDLSIGIGINTGDCVVGNMGSSRRFDYSALGDTVNLASRLEGQTKGYGVSIILGDATASALTGRFAVIELDLIRVKGKTMPERICALIGGPDLLERPDYLVAATGCNRALSAYRRQDWAEAEACIAEFRARAASFGLDGYLTMLAERIALFRTLPPPKDWDGVYEALTK